MMRMRYGIAFACCLVAASCSDRAVQPTDAGPRFELRPPLAAVCLTVDSLEGLNTALEPAGPARRGSSEWIQLISRLVGNGTAQDTAAARSQAFAYLRSLTGQFQAGSLIGGQSASTEALLQQLMNGILCLVGLPPAFGPGSLGPDGATAFVQPGSPDTDVVTQTQWAGMHVPTGSVTQPTIVTIQRLPDSPGPLLTPLDQYPIFYEFHSSPAIPFSQDLVLGICVASNATPPDPTRLRLAHNIAPFTANSIEILPAAPTPFLDCTNAPIAAATGRWGFDLARIGRRVERGLQAILLPQPLLALPFYGTGGVGGTVRNFSPFGVVDTLGVMTFAGSTNEFKGPVGGPANGRPAVVLRTPAGKPLRNIPVTFSVTSGGGSIAGASTVTNANGVAVSGVWTLGPNLGCGTVKAVAALPTPGSGLGGVPQTFLGCGR